MVTCTAIEAKSPAESENRKMERSTRAGSEIVDRDRQVLLYQLEDVIEIKENASSPAHAEDQKCTNESMRG